MFDLENYECSHMPFVANYKDGALQLCCLKINGKWKVHYYENGEWKKLKTYTPDDMTECCPTAEWHPDINGWTISFIAGGSTQNNWENIGFNLYRKHSLDDSAPVIVCPANVGYTWKNQITFAAKQGPIFQYEKDLKMTIALKNIEWLYRLSYDPFNPRRMLISAQKFNGELISFVFNPHSKECALIKDGYDVCYKCAVYNENVYYCKKLDGDDFELRKIVKAANPTYEVIDYNELIESVTVEREDYWEDEA